MKARWKVAAFTATRAEYGLLRGTLREIAADPELALRIIVGGTHLSAAHGMTEAEIIDDGFMPAARVPMSVETNDEASLVRAMAECTQGVGDALLRLRPDVLLVLGDRYELLSVASVASILRIPLAHISGGDVTEGAIDNQVRHALTKLSQLHLAGTRASADRIVQMGEDPARVFATGEPGLDEFVRAAAAGPPSAADRAGLGRDLGLDAAWRWVLFTYHPETLASDGVDEARVTTALDALARRTDVQTVLTAANADRGGDVINRLLRARAAREPGRFRFVPSLGHGRFVATLRQAAAVVGNSSAGVVEAASVPVAAVDIGDRQRGRPTGANVVHAPGDQASIERALDRVLDPAFAVGIAGMTNPYGDGHAATRIKEAVKAFLALPTTTKGFHELPRRAP